MSSWTKGLLTPAIRSGIATKWGVAATLPNERIATGKAFAMKDKLHVHVDAETRDNYFGGGEVPDIDLRPEDIEVNAAVTGYDVSSC